MDLIIVFFVAHAFVLSQSANDRGYYCIMLEDCCASYSPEFHEVAVRMITAQGGMFGSVSNSSALVESLKGEIAKDASVTIGTGKGDSFEVVDKPNGAAPASVSIPLDVPNNAFIDAKPYKWPYNGNMTPQNTALIVIDMQVDFCAK